MKLLHPNRILLLLVLTAFILRIITMLYSFQFRENTDVLRYKDWGRIAFLYSLEETYHTTHLEFGTQANNHPPGSLYILSGAYNLQIQFSKVLLRIFNLEEGSSTWINVQLLYAFLRFPSILADLIIGILIYAIVRSRQSVKKAFLSSSLFLFNPVILYNSAFWGQMDSINNMFFLTAIFFLMKRKYFFSFILFSLSFYVKLSLIFFLPILIIIYYLLVKNKTKLFISCVLSIIFICLITLPISGKPYIWLFEFVTKNGLGEMQNITAFAFNFWWMIFNPIVEIGNPNNLFTFSQVQMVSSPLSSTVYFGLSLMQWSLIIFGILLFPILNIIIKLKNKVLEGGNLFLIFSTGAMIAFIILPQMHERYLYPFFPLFAIYIGLTKKSIGKFLLLSLLNLINLYIVWHPMKIVIMPYSLMNNGTFQWLISASIVATGASLYFSSIKKLFAYGKTK